MDYYKVLGINKNASKSEIKQAFRNLAMQFHPDKHSSSPKSVREGATLRFKHVSEAYDVLSDDRKRADYNFRYSNQRTPGGFASGNSSTGYGYGYGYQNRNPNSSSSYYDSYYRKAANNGDEFVSKFETSLRFLTTRAFLLNAAFVGVLLGGTFVIDMGREALWKLRNPGKSFEEAMETIEKAKSVNDKA